LRLAVYGLLAVAAVLVLVVRVQPEREARWTHLAGKTSKGHKVRITLVDGRLTVMDVRPSGWCRPQSRWLSWQWHRVDGLGIVFDHAGSRFHIRERGREPRVRWVADARGELRDDGDSARGTVYTRWGNENSTCEGRVRFSARKTP
jgi:hypothetical protein